jgi:hypothetical protein
LEYKFFFLFFMALNPIDLREQELLRSLAFEVGKDDARFGMPSNADSYHFKAEYLAGYECMRKAVAATSTEEKDGLAGRL